MFRCSSTLQSLYDNPKILVGCSSATAAGSKMSVASAAEVPVSHFPNTLCCGRALVL